MSNYSPPQLIPVKPGDLDNLLLVSSVRYDPALLEEHDWHSTKSGGESKTPYLLLPFHLQRLEAAAAAFRWKAAQELLSQPDSLEKFHAALENAIDSARDEAGRPVDRTSAYQLHCILSPNGQMEIQVKPLSARPFDLLGAPYMTPAYLHPLTPTTLMTWPTAYAPILNVFLDTTSTPVSGTSYYKHTDQSRYLAARKRLGIDSFDSVDEVLMWNEDGEVTETSLRTVCVWREGMWVTPPLFSGCLDGSVRRWMLTTGKVRETKIMKDDLRPGEWILTSNGIEGCCFGKYVGIDRDQYNSVRGHDTLPGHSTIDYPR